MCAIFCYISNNVIKHRAIDKNIEYAFNLIKHRGPDNSALISHGNIIFGFHRLSIMDVSNNGMQPFEYDNYTMICNGEIYEYESLKNEIVDYEFKSTSDCEIIIPLFMKYGVKCFEKLSSEFACILRMNDTIYVARDGPVGNRPLFYCMRNNGDI